MKKRHNFRKIALLRKSLCLFLFIGGSISLHAQTAWEINGNSGTTTSNYLGTQDAVPLNIRTNNATAQPIIFQTGGAVERFRISAAGLLGLGTNSPTSMLHIYGNGSSNLFRTDGPVGIQNTWQLYAGGAEKFHILVPDTKTVFMSAMHADGTIYMQTGGTTHFFMQKSSSTLGVYGMNSAGYIGMGILYPGAPLHIVGQQPLTTENNIWKRGLLLDRYATIAFTADAMEGDQAFFMGAPGSGETAGNFYNGTSSTIYSNGTIDYASMIYSGTALGSNPLNSTQFFKNVIIKNTTNAANPPLGEERRLGINVLSPQNVVEINTSLSSPSPTGSGLRFTDLTSACTPVSNPGAGVLTVNAGGDVIYVPASTGSNGNGFFDCSDGSGAANLAADSKVNLNNHNLYFENNDGFDVNHVGIGYACVDPLPGKLSVHQVHPLEAASGTTAIYGLNSDIGEVTNLVYTGVEGRADGSETVDVQINRGGFFSAANSSRTIGVEVALVPSALNDNRAYGGVFTVSAASLDNIGVLAETSGSASRNVGGAFEADYSSATATNIGVYGRAANGLINYAGFFDGNVFTTGMYLPSDKKLKENIADYTEANELLSKLHPVSYNFKADEFPQLNLDKTPQIGFLSQELEKVLPNAVKETTTVSAKDENGKTLEPVTFKAVAYEKLIPVLVGGHQEQQTEITSLQAENVKLRQELDALNTKFSKLESCLQNLLPGLCDVNQGSIERTSPEQQLTVNLSDKNTIVLNQNVPNPFAESTVISYSIPATVKKAQIHFYDASGRLIQTVEVAERGAGRLQVFGNDLSSGTYTYSLVADGEVVATKKLVKE